MRFKSLTRSRRAIPSRRSGPSAAPVRARRDRGAARGNRLEPRAVEPAREDRQLRRRSGQIRRGFLHLAGEPSLPANHLRLRARGDGRTSHAQQLRASVSRSYAHQGAGTRQPTPWHQDQPYYNVDGTQNVSFWIPVDPVSRASTLEFVAGSHRGSVAHAALVHGCPGEMVSGGLARRSAEHRGAAPRLSHSRLGARAGRCRVLSHADAARLARRRGGPAPARFLRALPGRRHRACARGAGRPRRSSRVSRRSCPPARRCIIRLFPELWRES